MRIEFVTGAVADRLGVTPSGFLEDGRPLRESVDPETAENLETLLRLHPDESTVVELCLHAPDGESIWLQNTARCRQRDDGSTVVDVVCHDITRLKITQRDLARSERRNRLLVENAWDVIWTMALDGTITYVSPSVLRVRGITPEEAMQQSLDEIHPPADAEETMRYFGELFVAIANGTELPSFNGEKEYYRKDGSIMTGQLQVIPHVDEQGNVVEILGVTRDISDAKRYEQELHRLAVTDPLTGLLNRRHAQRLLHDHVAEVQSRDGALSVLMIDVDHFKKINDTAGHDAGDRALIALCDLFKAQCRPDDVLARWGGEEFVLILDGRDLAQATQVAEDLRREVHAATLGGIGDVTISVGAAQVHPGEALATLLERADKALYAAKDQGRNCVVSAP